MFLPHVDVVKGLQDMESVLGQEVDDEDGEAVAERLVSLNGWYTFGSRLVASAEFNKRQNKKSDEIWSTAIWADKLHSSCSYQIRSLITILSALKEDKRMNGFASRTIV